MKEDMRRRLPELLAPAGSPEALDAAIEAGADAVYFGASDFNARMRAKNFTEAEFASALKKCAEYGVKTYVTLNTRLRDAELSSALDVAKNAYLEGASALIVADAGLAREIKRAIPPLELHASTQMSGHSAKDAGAFYKMGFSRMVCPREMTRREIEALCEQSPIEIEMFIHGAHCVSFSGQCLMSYALGGRSGNRGMCAQPCRLPYKAEGVASSHPLSLKDMCLAGSIGELINTGVASLKIEGRQKSADYVYGVVKTYRRLLDERRGAAPDEIMRLRELFSRDGFTDGYLKSSYRGMLGMRDEDDRTANSGFSGLKKKIPLDMSLKVKTGCAPSLSATDGARSVTVYGDAACLPRDSGVAMTYDAAKDKASRLGGSAFVLHSFEADIDDDAYFTLSQLNSLRRSAVERLAFPEERGDTDVAPVTKARFTKIDPGERRFSAEFSRASQIPDEAYGFFDTIYVPLCDAGSADGERICLFCDPLTYGAEYAGLASRLAGYKGKVLVHGFGQASAVREAGAMPAASFRFNVTNSAAASAVLEFCDEVTISPEAPSALCRDIDGKTSVIVYGRIPLMHTERCVISDGGSVCPFGGNGGRIYPMQEKRAGRGAGKACDGVICSGLLTDRTGASFPVKGLADCSNVIYNSVPVYMADKMRSLEGSLADTYHFIFTVETKKECADIIEAYKSGDAPRDASLVRRIK
ncbi:MAG: U32 family peptidase [Clostridia bacterium]|nr:U32 family peptidase [Clostridia bacterium]